MEKVITTIGTSLFENALSDIGNNDHYEYIKKKTSNEWKSCSERIERLKSVLIKWLEQHSLGTAELKSLGKIKELFKNELDVLLLATDSVTSRLAAEILKEHYKGNDKNIIISFDPDKDVITGLQVNNSRTFEKEGLVNLIERIEEFTQGYYQDVVINITGGYKAVIPYLTIYGQVNNIPLYYIFEDTDSLIKIPQGPIDINWGIFEKYKTVVEKLDQGVTEKKWEQFKRENNIEDDFPDIVCTMTMKKCMN